MSNIVECHSFSLHVASVSPPLTLAPCLDTEVSARPPEGIFFNGTLVGPSVK